MRVRDLNWMQLETYLEDDDRAVLPLGSTEQHAYLSLETDNILAERVAAEAAEPLGVPVFPVLSYGLTPGFSAYPGTLTLRLDTFTAVLFDLLDALYDTGFRRILLLNGHGGNAPARAVAAEWLLDHEDAQVIYHDWFEGPRVDAVVLDIDGEAEHASWVENFPWTRVAGVDPPAERKPMFERPPRVGSPEAVRDLLGDGSMGGLYARDDVDMLRVWQTAVEEVRELLESGWSSD